jgi:endo-1,4-beta-xylanase
MKVRGHCLAWSRDNPEWLAEGHFTPAELSPLSRDHITHVMKHYVAQVFAWDVVNEAWDEDSDLRDSAWYNRPGIGFAGKGTLYIEQAFRWAHEAEPYALRFYNEAEEERLNRKSDAILRDGPRFQAPGFRSMGLGSSCISQGSISFWWL